MRLLNGCAAVAVLTMLFVAGCTGLRAKPSSDVNFSGEWHLNTALSEDPAAMERGGRGPGSSGGGMGRGGRGPGGGGMGGMGGMGGRGPGGGGPSGGFGGRGGGSGKSGGPGATREFMDQPEKLSITQAPADLSLAADGVPTKYVYGEKVSGTAEREAGWKGNDFIVKRSMKDGPSATRTYSLTDDGRQLVVSTKISGGRGPGREFVSIYERQ